MTQPFKTKLNGLFVMLPENADRLKVFNDEKPYLSYFVGVETHRLQLPQENWTLLGNAFSLSESDKERICESESKPIGWRLDGNESKMNKITLWVNYHYYKPQPASFACDTLNDSYASLLQREKVYEVNPLGEFPKSADFDGDVSKFDKHIINWQSAQSRTSKNWWVLIPAE